MTPSLRCLTDLERVWLAAIIDGEGCIRINRVRREKHKALWRYYPAIEFTNTNEALVKRFVELTEPWVTSIGEYPNNHFVKNAKRRFQVSIRYKDCRAFINAIRPFLIAKGAQADLALEFLDIQEKERPKGKRMVPQYNELYIRSRLLNKKGTDPLDVEKLRQDIQTPCPV